MNSALLKNNLAAIVADSQTRKVLSRSGLIAGLCISSIVSSYAIKSRKTKCGTLQKRHV